MANPDCAYCEGTDIVEVMIRQGVDTLTKVAPCPWCENTRLVESLQRVMMWAADTIIYVPKMKVLIGEDLLKELEVRG